MQGCYGGNIYSILHTQGSSARPRPPRCAGRPWLGLLHGRGFSSEQHSQTTSVTSGGRGSAAASASALCTLAMLSMVSTHTAVGCWYSSSSSARSAAGITEVDAFSIATATCSMRELSRYHSTSRKGFARIGGPLGGNGTGGTAGGSGDDGGSGDCGGCGGGRGWQPAQSLQCVFSQPQVGPLQHQPAHIAPTLQVVCSASSAIRRANGSVEGMAVGFT